MLSISEVFQEFEKVGDCGFATLDGEGGVSARVAQFFACDEEGLYLRTMTGKPFYRQLVEGGQLAVSGQYIKDVAQHDDRFRYQPGVAMRVQGQVRQLTYEELSAKAAVSDDFNVAVHDMERYPETVAFVLYRAWGERFDYDFNMVTRDHKLERERFSWGGATFAEPGFHITDDCIECGACKAACTFKAIEAGTPYRILGNRCDECGDCHQVCPADAVVEKGLA